jgi:plasmid stability protein
MAEIHIRIPDALAAKIKAAADAHLRSVNAEIIVALGKVFK